MRPGVIGGWRPVLQIEEDVVVRVLQGEYDAVGVIGVLVPLQRLVDALRDAKLDPQGSLDHVPGGTGPMQLPGVALEYWQPSILFSVY